MAEKYGIALVGCGYMGAAHLDEIYYRDNIEVRWVVDTDLSKAQLFKRKYGALNAGADLDECLGDAGVDIVIIATYPSTHLKILKTCLFQGKHVLCEKPIATTSEDAAEFVRLVKEAETKVLIGHILRHNKTFLKVRQMIEDGAIGKPIVIRMVQNKHTTDWQRHVELISETSPLIDCGVHYIDIMQWFTGAKIASVSGVSANIETAIPSDKYNYGMFCVRLEDGSVGYYEVGWGNTIASQDIKEFIGPRGRIRVDYRNQRYSHQEEGDLIEYFRYPEKVYDTINVDSERKPTWEQLQYLIRMIEDDLDAKPTIDEVYDAFVIAMAADEAVKTGKTLEMTRRF